MKIYEEGDNLDAELENADWIKTKTWDLPITKDEFLEAIGGPEYLAHFMTLPAAKAMPQALKTQLGYSS
jgi:hypothetical protein